MAINGPFHVGDCPNISIFRDRTMAMLDYGERVEAEDMYKGELAYSDLPSDCLGLGCIHERWEQRQMKGLVCARHETVNRRFKQFICLNQVYRHELDCHSSISCDVVVLTQIGIDQGEFGGP